MDRRDWTVERARGWSRRASIALAVVLLLGIMPGLVRTATAADAAVRVLAVDGDTGALTVLDGADGTVLGRFSAPTGGFVPVASSESGRYFLANHYDGGAVTLVDSGLQAEPHGDHVDLHEAAPFVRATVASGGSPAHYWVHDGLIAVYHDADGTVALFDEETLATDATPRVFSVGPPDHASIATIDDTLLVGFYQLGRIDAYAMDGTLIRENIAACPGTHGEARAGDTVAFACADGILLVRADLTTTRIAYTGSAATPGASPEATPAPTSGTPAPAEPERSNLIAAHPDSPLLIGDLPSGLAIIDPVAERIDTMPLPAQPLWMTFVDGETLAVLTADGNLHVVDPITREVRWTVAATTPYTSFGPEDANTLYPFIAAAAGAVYVPDPAAGTVVAVDAASGEITGRFAVGGRPARVAAVTATGIHHE